MKIVKFVLPLFLLTLVVAAVVYFTPRLITVDQIVCRSQFGPCSPNIDAKVISYEGKSLAEAKSSIGNFLKPEGLVSEYSFQFKIPDRLEVDIIEGKAKYAIVKNDTDIFSLIDGGGKVIKVENSTNLPTLYVSDNPPNLGEMVSPEQIFALGLVSRMFSTYQVKNGKRENSSLVTELPDGITVIFPLEGDEDELMGALVLILSKLKSPSKDSKIDYSTVKKIDLRFRNPVLQ